MTAVPLSATQDRAVQLRQACRDLPHAWQTPAVSGRIKLSPEDFRVEEVLGFDPDGEGEHLCLWLEKRRHSTREVQQALARAFNIAPADVGFSGMKDKQAVTRQWYSARLKTDAGAELPALPDGIRVLDTRRNSRKLKIGSHRRNRFRILIRQLQGDTSGLAGRIALMTGHGVPNYFGMQRFGNDGGNLLQALDWFAGTTSGRGHAPGRLQRSLMLSAARAFLFNRVLAQRVSAGNWNRALAGELLALAGSGSVFHADRATADEITRRLALADIHPSGPLWGKGAPRTSDEALALEQDVAGRHDDLCAGLVAAGLEHERRPLRMMIHALQYEHSDDTLQLEFELDRGCYATVALRELVRIPE